MEHNQIHERTYIRTRHMETNNNNKKENKSTKISKNTIFRVYKFINLQFQKKTECFIFSGCCSCWFCIFFLYRFRFCSTNNGIVILKKKLRKIYNF